MHSSRVRRFRHAIRYAGVAMVAAALAGCTSASTPKPKLAGTSKEYFSEAEYGVKASPKVTSKRSNLRRGGGREQIGKPYKVRGKWYRPKEDPDYVKVGAASWYGSAFHGRLTANGEVYDMTHLTAAHPTMPLPSYARVTNMANGSSVVVRVNDRGPFAHNRIIDLSKRAAELLDYTHSGVAKVKVEYMGRAPLHGQDDQFLMASYQPGEGMDDVIQPGVMIAMNGPTPSAPVGVRTLQPEPLAIAPPATIGDPALPAFGPALPERPAVLVALSYAEQRAAGSAAALEAFASEGSAAWKDGSNVAASHPAGGEYVSVGTYADRDDAERLVAALSAHGRAEIVTDSDATNPWYTVNVHPDGRAPVDDILRQAWAAGADEALTVRE